MSADNLHPGPWRWQDGALLDARGEMILALDDDADYPLPGGLEGEMTSAAPPEVLAVVAAAASLRTALTAVLDYVREAFEDGWRPKSSDIGPGCMKARVLLDALKAGTPTDTVVQLGAVRELARDPDECLACGKDAEDCETDGNCPGGVARRRARGDRIRFRG